MASKKSKDTIRVRKTHENGFHGVAPPAIYPTAVYTRQQVEEMLGLGRETLAREIRHGRLRVSRRAGRYWFLGEWLLAWLTSGEEEAMRRRKNRVSGTDSPVTGRV